VAALIDTHTFLWWCVGDSRLSLRAKAIIEEEPGQVFLSVISAWEIIIKAMRGRLVLPEAPQPFIASRMALGMLTILPVELRHAMHVANLPLLHHDPFDRMLIAQSVVEHLPLVTADEAIRQYELDIVW
jgi:PIN domain nuclease of toxin-antitoxin system